MCGLWKNLFFCPAYIQKPGNENGHVECVVHCEYAHFRELMAAERERWAVYQHRGSRRSTALGGMVAVVWAVSDLLQSCRRAPSLALRLDASKLAAAVCRGGAAATSTVNPRCLAHPPQEACQGPHGVCLLCFFVCCNWNWNSASFVPVAVMGTLFHMIILFCCGFLLVSTDWNFALILNEYSMLKMNIKVSFLRFYFYFSFCVWVCMYVYMYVHL